MNQPNPAQQASDAAIAQAFRESKSRVFHYHEEVEAFIDKRAIEIDAARELTAAQGDSLKSFLHIREYSKLLGETHSYEGIIPLSAVEDAITALSQPIEPQGAVVGDAVAKVVEEMRYLVDAVREYSTTTSGGAARYVSGAMKMLDRALAALPVAVGAGEDAELLDWLDAANLKMRMGWKVGKAPAGNVSVTSIIFLGSEPVPIREAIRAAMTPATPAGKGSE